MAIDVLVKPLLRQPLFQGLKPLQLTEIVRRADRIVYKPGDVLIEEDKHGDSAILIVAGEGVRMRGGEESAPGESVPEGSMVAELAMLVETVHASTIVARTPIRALKISREDMHAQMLDDPKLAEHLMGRIAMRLQVLAAEVRAIDEVLSLLASDEHVSPTAAARAGGGGTSTTASASLH